MTDYGVTDQGFVRKGLQDILSEREAENLKAFGPGLIQTAQTPTGQINGLWSDAEAEYWEIAVSVYRSLDPDQARGVRLDELGRLRLIERVEGESDASFAKAITNEGAANVRDADFYRAVRNANGVTWARIFVTDDEPVDPFLPLHSVAVSVMGGDDDEIAHIAREFIVPGIISAGNTRVETVIGGMCRSIRIHRPVPVNVYLEVTVNKFNDQSGCPPPPNTTLAAVVLERFSGDQRPANGQPITDHQVRLALAQFPSVELVSVEARKYSTSASPLPTPVTFTFEQIARVRTVLITVANA